MLTFKERSSSFHRYFLVMDYNKIEPPKSQNNQIARISICVFNTTCDTDNLHNIFFLFMAKKDSTIKGKR